MVETYLLNGDRWDDNPFASHEEYTTAIISCDPEVVGAIEEAFAHKALSVSSFEQSKGAHWQVKMLLAGKHESLDLSGIGGVHEVVLEPLEMQDWVAENQKNFPPLEIGGFYIHGSHLPPKAEAISLEIDAGRAFGTGEHATTAGCLLAMQKLNQMSDVGCQMSEMNKKGGQQGERAQLNIKRIADIGCGTGILAMAAHRLWPQAFVIGSDMDAPSVATAIENAARNGMPELPFVTAAGTQHEEIQAHAPYDLIIANILAGPLVQLAPEMVAALAKGGYMILSGLLTRQEEEVIAAYEARGLTCTDRLHRDEWSALTLHYSL